MMRKCETSGCGFVDTSDITHCPDCREKLPAVTPIDMVLYCPNCGHQHIDKAETPQYEHHEGLPVGPNLAWTNPPHRSHQCGECGCIWRPADVPTNGVEAVKTKGKVDTWEGAGMRSFAKLHHWHINRIDSSTVGVKHKALGEASGVANSVDPVSRMLFWLLDDILQDRQYGMLPSRMKGDREAHRTQYSDQAFQKWLDESITENGEFTVWHMLRDVCSAYHGWAAANSKDIADSYLLADLIANAQSFIARLETMNFECEGGPLRGAIVWQHLKQAIAALQPASNMLVKPYVVSPHAFGGITGINDYKMSDGSIEAMTPKEAALRMQPPSVMREVECLRDALIYVAFSLHGTHQHQLAEGITLIDNDRVRVKLGDWTVDTGRRDTSTFWPFKPSDTSRIDALMQPGWELSINDDPESLPSELWQVHKVSGSRNDREWRLLGEGADPRAAIDAAVRNQKVGATNG